MPDTRGLCPSPDSRGPARQLPIFRRIYFLKGLGDAEWGARAPSLGFSFHRPESSARLRRLGAKRESHDSPARPRRGHRPGCDSKGRNPARCREKLLGHSPPCSAAGNRGERRRPGPASFAPLAPPIFPAPWPERRPHHHHQGLAVHRWEPPATSPASELQGGRHLAGADLCYTGRT